MNHTPGPWSVIADPGDGFEFDIKANGYYIAAIPDVPGETEANANLIATAPYLLKVMLVAHEMRAAQKRYFKERTQSALTESKRFEKELDRLLAEVLP